MNDFQPLTYSDTVTADRPWLASLVGVQDTNTIALDLTKFTVGVHYTAATMPLLQGRNVMKSGIPLGKITESGLYAPYAGPTSEVQTLTVTGSPTGGTFTITWSGQTTAAIAYNAAASTVQSALEALSNIAVGDVTVTGAAGGPWTLHWAGAQLGDDVAAPTTTSSLTGGSTPGVTVATTTAGGAASASDGTEVLAGFLVDHIFFNPTSTKAGGALLWYGEVFASELPVPFDPTDVASVAPGVNIHYR
ncbi:hypothetical protein OG552_10420 [Streptomyces sp. NBC_01476]|uniref:hypothetical protein n=1 Tax=Streptomyces sp. NBC_01476 TaxID=2903881 RepID=UPI002E31D4D6|nr:hypothetical protein [Streptomyces sp. NBC_01476]